MQIIRLTIVDDQNVRVTVAVGIERCRATAASCAAGIPRATAARVNAPSAFAIAKPQIIGLKIVDDQDVRVTVAVDVERGRAIAVSCVGGIPRTAATRVDTSSLLRQRRRPAP